MDVILKNTSLKSHASLVITATSAVMNLICSVVLSQFYYWIARKLTDMGNKDDFINIFIFNKHYFF